MSVHASPKLIAYVALGVVGLLAAVVTGSASLAVLAVPFVFIAGFGVTVAARPAVTIESSVDRESVLVGEPVNIRLRVSSDVTLHAEVDSVVPPTVQRVEEPLRGPIWLRAGAVKDLTVSTVPRRFGRPLLGAVMLKATDPLGLLQFEQRGGTATAVSVYPHVETLRGLLNPSRLGPLAGDLVSRVRGDGLEFADIGELQPGDALRRVNWPATSRLGTVHVNRFHPERNSDLVLVLDVLTDAGAASSGMLNRAASATLAIAARHLRRRDAVGLLPLGSTARPVEPRLGRTQLHRITEAVLDAEPGDEGPRAADATLSRRMLRPASLIIAITPLFDSRSVDLLLALRSHGHDVVALELPLIPNRDSRDTVDRLWDLKRAAVRATCLAAGVLVVAWPENRPLAGVIEEADRWRRGALRLAG